MLTSIALATSHLEPLLPITRAAEEAGLHRVWTTEGFGSDGLVRAAHLLAGTSRIGVGTGIAYAFSRAPLALAMAAADLAALGPGRFTLGLGAGTPGVRARRFDVAGYDHPAPRTAEYASLVRAALRSEAGLEFAGRFYHCSFPQLNWPQPAEQRHAVEVYAAALHPAMLRAAARSCDGIALHSLATSASYLRTVVAPLVAGPSVASPVRVAAWRMCVVDSDAGRALAAARQQLAFYFSTPSYRSVLAGTAWDELAPAIQDAARAAGYRDWSAAAALVPDDMVTEFCVAGDPSECARQLRALRHRFAAAGVDEVVLQLRTADTPADTLRNGLALVEAAAPDPSGVNSDALV